MSRGNDKRLMFLDEVDYERYLGLLERSAERFGVQVIGYTLMPNHVHLLLRPTAQPLWRLMQQVNSAYCGWFNRRHGHVGHVLQGRYKAQIIEGGPSFLRVLRYVMLNPAAAGLVRHAADWRWSSYRQTAGVCASGDLELADIWQTFDPDPATAQHLFRRFVEGDFAVDEPLDGLLVGSDGFIRGFAPALASHGTNREFVSAERFAARPSLQELLPDKSRGSRTDQIVRTAFQIHAFTLREIAEHVGVAPSTVWVWAQRAAPVFAGQSPDLVSRL
jgi:REP element-mobilizing transposase RayT